jgi:hypothetical protein
MRGAARHARLDQITGAFLGGDRQMRQDGFIRLDAGHLRRSRHMRHPRQRLVEMHVTIDETRQHQIAAGIEDRHAVRQRRRGVLADGSDTPAGDPDIDEAPVGETATLAHGPGAVNRVAQLLVFPSSASIRDRALTPD